MTHLLDVNVLLALFDDCHAHHEAAHAWFGGVGRSGWATSAITELGFIQVLSNPAYPGTRETPGAAAQRLARFCESGGHRFWSDDVPARNSRDDDVWRRLRGHRQVTDFHLAALAARHRGRLATFDVRLARTLRGTRLEPAVALVG